MITLKFYYYVGEINNELGEVLRRILKRNIFGGSFDIGRYICSFQSRRRDGTLKRKVERYLEKITVSRNCFSIDRSGLQLCDLFFVQELMSFSQSRTHPF